MTVETALTEIHHFAIPVKDLNGTVAYYLDNFHCTVEYQDETWALLAFANIKLAFVMPHQHPPHLAIVVENAESYGPLKTHRDGTKSVYIKDPSGNSIEIMAPLPSS
jgi:extradiol dioxygenase family protein